MSAEISFLASFFFVSNVVFFTVLAELARQIIGEVFFVLLFITLFSRNITGVRKWFLFLVFSFGLVVSHYALAYIFLGFIALTWLVSRFRKGIVKINLSLVVLFGILVFVWYIYTSQASTFNDLLSNVNYVGKGFASDFFNAQSRSGEVLQAVGFSGISTVWHSVGRGIYYVTEGLIILGFAFMLLKDRFSFFKEDYNVLIFLNLALLSACIVLPNFSNTFNASRFYHVTLFFLAPLCILGGLNLLKFLGRLNIPKYFLRNRINEKTLLSLLLFCILIPFFLFQTGFVYEVTNEESYTLSLGSYRLSALSQANLGLLTDAEVQSGNWLSQNAGFYKIVYADISSLNIFTYTQLNRAVFAISPVYFSSGSYVYLREYNVEDGIVFTDSGQYTSLSLNQIVPSLNNDANLIYSTGSCEIFTVIHVIERLKNFD